MRLATFLTLILCFEVQANLSHKVGILLQDRRIAGADKSAYPEYIACDDRSKAEASLNRIREEKIRNFVKGQPDNTDPALDALLSRLDDLKKRSTKGRYDFDHYRKIFYNLPRAGRGESAIQRLCTDLGNPAGVLRETSQCLLRELGPVVLKTKSMEDSLSSDDHDTRTRAESVKAELIRHLNYRLIGFPEINAAYYEGAVVKKVTRETVGAAFNRALNRVELIEANYAPQLQEIRSEQAKPHQKDWDFGKIAFLRKQMEGEPLLDKLLDSGEPTKVNLLKVAVAQELSKVLEGTHIQVYWSGISTLPGGAMQSHISMRITQKDRFLQEYAKGFGNGIKVLCDDTKILFEDVQKPRGPEPQIFGSLSFQFTPNNSGTWSLTFTGMRVGSKIDPSYPVLEGHFPGLNP